MGIGTDVTPDPDALGRWFESNVILLLVLAGVLIVLYAFSSRLLRSAITRALSAQHGAAEGDATLQAELAKRASTLHGLALTILRLAIVLTFVIILIGLLDLWGVIAGVGLIVAALTLAGQPIVLDYLMGVVIVLEGQYFIGDWIAVGSVSGEVESVGLRRTVIRDTTGSVHSISNRDIGLVTNETRVFATAEVEMVGIRDEDLARVIEIMDEVGREVAADPKWSARILETPAFALVSDFDDLGISVKMRGRVPSADRWAIASELRRRLVAASLAEDIDFNRRGVESRVPRAGSSLHATEPPDDASASTSTSTSDEVAGPPTA